jgi:uncharacterized protein YukE
MITLPSVPAEVPALEVDPASILDYARALLAGSAQVDDLGSFVAGAARIEDWEGAAGTSYTATITPIGTQADAASLALRRVGLRVDQHGRSMADLLAARTELVLRRTELARAVTYLALRAPTVTLAEAADFQSECDAVAGHVRDLADDVASWAARVTSEETEMSHAFGALMTIDQALATYADEDDPADAALATMPGPGASADQVHRWWQGLTQDQQWAIFLAAPRAIGDRDGIPAWARDRANRVALDCDVATWSDLDRRGLLTADEQRWYANALSARDALDRMGDALDPVTGQPVRTTLYIYDPTAFGGDGRVAIAAGDLDVADNVAVVVPGFGTDMGSAEYQGGRAIDLYTEARSLDPHASDATMFWIGYDAPDNVPWGHGADQGWDAADVASEQAAARGGDRLADTLDGLAADRAGDPAHVTVIGHSYGSTTTGVAATEHHLPVEDVVFVGSPGVGEHADHVGDLQVGPAHVWVGAASTDPVSWLGNHGWVNTENLTGGGGLGTDPASDDFGGTRFDAEVQGSRGGLHLGDHSAYFTPGSESLDNIAHVVNGQYAAVTHADGRHDPWWGPAYDPEAR